MLTKKQIQLLEFIQARMARDGVPPSFDEMKLALDLRSKSGIHRLVTALEERGFIRRLPHRARALEIVRLPDSLSKGTGFQPRVIEGSVPERPAPLPRGARTTVQVFDRDGRQLGGATLTARWAGGPWLPTLLLEEGRGADGSIDLGRLGPGAWQFRVTHPAIGTVEAARTIGSEPSVTIVVAPQ